jgi:hypothetical protein
MLFSLAEYDMWSYLFIIAFAMSEFLIRLAEIW